MDGFERDSPQKTVTGDDSVMELQLEDLAHKQEAIDAVVRLFEGQPRNTFDMERGLICAI